MTEDEWIAIVRAESQRVARRFGLDTSELESRTIAKIWEAGKIQSHPKPDAYIKLVVRNEAIDMLRERKRAPKTIGDFQGDLEESRLFDRSGDSDTLGDDASNRTCVETPPLAETVKKLRHVDWGRSKLKAFLLLDARLLLAKKLQVMSDDELRHVGQELNQDRTRIEYIEAIFPWDTETGSLGLGNSALSIHDAWKILAKLVVRSAAYHHADRTERKQFPKTKLVARSIVEYLRDGWPQLQANTWTVNCVRAWRKVGEQFPEITAELNPHSRGKNNE